MPFKDNWEGPVCFLQQDLGKITSLAEKLCPREKIEQIEFLSGGAGNLNFKALYKKNTTPYVIRIYMRDPKVVFLEQSLGRFLSSSIPLPQVLSIIEGTPPCALVTFIDGISLKDLLLNHRNEDSFDVLQEVGQILAKIHMNRFFQPGTLTPSLEVEPFASHLTCTELGLSFLKSEMVQRVLSAPLISQIEALFRSKCHFFPQGSEACLIHGDFNPANILVRKERGRWGVSGILDWEFAFSGSPLWDIANFLRYAHTQDSLFQTVFLEGFKRGGGSLPDAWEITIDLLNLLALLDILALRTTPQQVNKITDIQGLLAQGVKRLEG